MVNPIVDSMNVFVGIWNALPVSISGLIEFAFLLFLIRQFVHLFFQVGG